MLPSLHRHCGTPPARGVKDMMTTKTVFGPTAVMLFALGMSAVPNQSAADRGLALKSEAATRSVVVRYVQDDLGQPEGQRELSARIEAAARRACGPVEIKEFHVRRAWKRCYQAALTDALNQINTPRLAAVQE
jgi:UrcA family protein